MKIQFLGAAGNVTGSRFLLETDASRILIDCGLYQEREFRSRNWENFPVKPSTIDCVLLTHAHIDHCGYLPKLVKEGFQGTIHCTAPTAEIAQIALLDAAKLQVEDAEFKKKRHGREKRKGPYPAVPLYTVDDAQAVSAHFNTLSYGEEVEVSGDTRAVFHDAGHILGASMIELKIREKGRERSAVFSGDIGRWDKPILCDPTLFAKADFVFMESTYGNRLHKESGEGALDKLERIILRTKQAGGNVVIPTFAIERAQEILYSISTLLEENRIPPMVVFVDSPMAINVTEVFKKYPDYFDDEARTRISEGRSPFAFPLLKSTRTSEQSKAINALQKPCIILAGSGMCTGGRIKHHLVHNIESPENTILFVGYQARGTLGREILERPERVRILGRDRPVRAGIEKINGFSAHADRDELLKWVYGFKEAPTKIFVVHGEAEASENFAALLRNHLHSDVIVPNYLEEYFLQ